MKRLASLGTFLLLWASVFAQTYIGKVVDEKGAGIGYATVYLADNPVVGTATNNDGFFTLTTADNPYSTVIISFIGYAKAEMPLAYFSTTDTAKVVLHEQPIALEEAVVSAKPAKQRNKRKMMQLLLEQVYATMEEDFPTENVKYQVVSDLRMDSGEQPWGMEQMIATSVLIPDSKRNKDGALEDSIQFSGDYCKRFFSPELRTKADNLLHSGKMDKRMYAAASEIDSGIVIHQILWSRDIKHAFAKRMKHPRRWQVTNENEGETVLSYTEKTNIIGIFKVNFTSHFIVNSTTYRVLRFSEEISMEINLPFGHTLKGEELEYMNLINLTGVNYEKFRLRRMKANIRMNTIYKIVNSKLCPSEKNMTVNATITGTKKENIPLIFKATQHATSIQTQGVQPMQEKDIKRRINREIVPIY